MAMAGLLCSQHGAWAGDYSGAHHGEQALQPQHAFAAMGLEDSNNQQQQTFSYSFHHRQRVSSRLLRVPWLKFYRIKDTRILSPFPAACETAWHLGNRISLYLRTLRQHFGDISPPYFP